MMRQGQFHLIIALVMACVFLNVALLACNTRDASEPVARSSDNYGWLRVEQVTLSGTGVDGTVSASDETDGVIRGRLHGVHLDFASGVTTTTDVTITQASPALTILQLSNYYTDTWYYPAAQQTNSAGAAISGAYERLLVADRLTVAVGETISGTIMTATIYYGE
jgi:hypothetical protein